MFSSYLSLLHLLHIKALAGLCCDSHLYQTIVKAKGERRKRRKWQNLIGQNHPGWDDRIKSTIINKTNFKEGYDRMKPGHLPLRPSKEIALLPLHLGYCCLLNEKCTSCTKWEWFLLHENENQFSCAALRLRACHKKLHSSCCLEPFQLSSKFPFYWIVILWWCQGGCVKEVLSANCWIL